MTLNGRTFAYGTLKENGDTWLLMTRDRAMPLDMALFPLSLAHKSVSFIEKMGIPPSFPGVLKLIVERLSVTKTSRKERTRSTSRVAEALVTKTGCGPNENSWGFR